MSVSLLYGLVVCMVLRGICGQVFFSAGGFRVVVRIGLKLASGSSFLVVHCSYLACSFSSSW